MRNVSIALFLLPFLASGGRSEQAPPAASPSDVKLTLGTRGGETTFQIGQVIPLTLSFTSTKPKEYQIDLRSYDRSGRLKIDQVAIDPSSGWDDPLALYFASYTGFIGGGLGSLGELSGKATVVQFNLNETVRFTKPGAYRVRVTSPRVSRLGDVGKPGGTGVTSNEIPLTIVPATAQWQRQTLERALAVLNGPKPTTNDAWEQRRKAIAAVRYLGTPDAARELALRLNEPDLGWDCELGIAGLLSRDAALTEMKALLKDPDFPVNSLFLSAISIAALPANMEGDLPAQREALESGFRQELADLLSTKRNEALAVSATAIVEEAAIRSRELPAALKRKTSEALAANFDRLPAGKQMELLQYRWKVLDHATMLPLVRRVAQRYTEFPAILTQDAYQFNLASAAALQDWYEIEPGAARAAVLEEILRPHPRFNASVLGILPDEVLPEVDQPLAQHLSDSDALNANGNAASLIHRYATSGIEAQVASYLDEHVGKCACAVLEPLLAYLLKHDPPAARSRLEAVIAARVAAGHYGCNSTLFSQVGKLQNHPLLHELAVASLDDSDSRLVADAAAYLAQHGTSVAEETLWEHLATWNKRWKGREAELQFAPGRNMAGMEANLAGSNMIQALATAPGWLADETKLNRLTELAVGEQQLRQVKEYLGSWNAQPLAIQCVPTDPVQFQIAQYHADSLAAAKEKLSQFPRGSRFRWMTGGPQAAFRELSRFASGLGLEIIRDPQ